MRHDLKTQTNKSLAALCNVLILHFLVLILNVTLF